MTVDELERCLAELLTLARSRGIHEIERGTHDHYWCVSSPEWLDMTREPKLGVGSLEDDRSELRKLLAQPERASSVDLDRAAAMLRLLSEKISR